MRDYVPLQRHKREVRTLRAAFARRHRFGLCPTDVLEVDVPLPWELLVQTVKKMGANAREMTLRVKDTYDGWNVLRTLFVRQPDVLTSTMAVMTGTTVAPYLETLELCVCLDKNDMNEASWRPLIARIFEERRYLQGAKVVWIDGSTTNVTRKDHYSV